MVRKEFAKILIQVLIYALTVIGFALGIYSLSPVLSRIKLNIVVTD